MSPSRAPTGLRKWSNVAVNALRPGYLQVMTRKVAVRMLEWPRRGEAAEARRWCESVASDCEAFARGLSPELWAEAVAFGEALERQARSRLAELGIDLGGGGHHPLLYFLVRWKKPSTVIETGVAAGFSTQAVLAALDRNGAGRLFSSEFPYFRLEDPERFVGFLVEDGLKDRWQLFLRGDRRNLPEMVRQAGRIDLAHYDSDKSYSGRRHFVDVVTPHLSPDALVVMDDVQDNAFFREHVESTRTPFHVFEFGGKFLGLAGPMRTSPKA